jgi:hypothetical protein
VAARKSAEGENERSEIPSVAAGKASTSFFTFNGIGVAGPGQKTSKGIIFIIFN